MAIHSSTLAWKIPWMEESGRLQSIGLQFQIHFLVFSELLILFIEFFFDMSVLRFEASLSSFPLQFYVRDTSLFLCHGLP